MGHVMDVFYVATTLGSFALLALLIGLIDRRLDGGER
jgi:hypothetical protein